MTKRGPSAAGSPRSGSAVERLRAWGAEPTGETWVTESSELAAGVLVATRTAAASLRGASAPASTGPGEPVIVKVARIEEERRGNRLMAWWSRCGGLPVLEADDDAILMRRATGGRCLIGMSAVGRDDEAEEVLLDAVLALHAMPAPPASVGLVPLRVWFQDLVDGPQEDPLLRDAASLARELLAEPGPTAVLHGDIHHGNVLDLGDRWAAVDPKGLVGHPAFDVANLCCNPSERTAIARLDRRLDRFAERLGLERAVLEAWVAAWSGLSLTWSGATGSWHSRSARFVATELLGRR